MSSFIFKPMLQRAVTILCILLLGSGSFSSAREPVYNSPDVFPPQTPPPVSANELANLVAPIALYPDPLLSQVLVACTYPLELVEAQQWLQQNGNLQGEQLMDAAKQQNWDPSVQALVAFPDVLALLSRNIRWTTDLGNAFLAQQFDVMDAIQALRAQARRNGQLVSTPQLSVNSETQNGQNAIEIQPVDPQIMYVPAYDPAYVWGSPVAGSYPALPYQESGYGSLFQSAINLAGLFSGFPGLLGWNGWGWALNWLAHALFINNPFFSDFGFHNSSGGYGESAVWAHNPAHRHGVPYANGFVASRYRGGAVRLQTAAPLGMSASGWRKLGSSTQMMMPGAQSGRAFAPQRSAGSESFQRDNRAAMPGNWRAFSRGTRTPTGQYTRAFAQPAWAGKRELQPNSRIVRDTYLANSANYRTPSFGGSRSLPSGYGAFSNSKNSRIPSASRTIARSNGLWGQPSHFSPPRMSSQHASRPQHSFARQHFSAPHFSAPHSGSHGSAHFSRGHSGGKSRKR